LYHFNLEMLAGPNVTTTIIDVWLFSIIKKWWNNKTHRCPIQSFMYKTILQGVKGSVAS
jgi:hypothetical protein